MAVALGRKGASARASVAAARGAVSQDHSAQATKLMPFLFEPFDEAQQLRVFHVGPALQDTLDFFSGFRCKLHFLDLFSELPIVADEASPDYLALQYKQLLQFPADTQFDICLFWDLFNFLDRQNVQAFLSALQPFLRETTRAHAFSVHNLNSQPVQSLYGMSAMDALSVRNRPVPVPGYAPHSQRQLTDLLYCFNFERSVLLPDSRLELLLRAKI